MQRMRSVHLFFIALLCFVCVSDPCAATPRFTQYTTEQGLCNDFIRCIYRDHLGFLWIGTFDGLSVFDGVHCRNYKREFGNSKSLPSTTIMDIKEDRYGTIWMATPKGVCRYDNKKQEIIRADMQGADSVYLPYTLLFEQDKLWMVSQESVDCFDYDDKGKVRLRYKMRFPWNVDLIDYRRRIFCSTDGQIFVLGGYRFFKVDTARKQIGLYEFTDAKGNKLPVAYFVESSPNKYWLMSATRQAIFLFDPAKKQQTIKELYRPGLLSDTAFHFISAASGSPDGNTSYITLGSSGDGLFIFNIEAKKFSRITSNTYNKYSLSSNQVNTLYRDRENLFWLGTAYGLNLYDPTEQRLETVFIDNEKADDMISDAVPDMRVDGAYWLGMLGNGILEYKGDGTTIKQYQLSDKVHSKVQYLFTQEDGTLWIGGEDGLYRKNAESGRLYKVAIKGEQPISVSYITSLGKDSLIICSFENGCWIYNYKNGTARQLTTKDGLFSNRCTHVSKSGDGKIFIGHIGTGMTIIDTRTWKIEAIPFQQFTEKELNYPSTFTYCSYVQDDSILWVGTGLGLVRFNYQSKQGELIAVSTRLKTDNEIWSIIAGRDHMLWLKTTFGVYKFDSRTQRVLEFFPLERKNIHAQDGYFRMRQLNDSTLIIPAYRSFYKLSIGTPDTQRILRAPILTSLKIEDKYLDIDPGNTSSAIELKPGESSLNLRFVTPDFHHAQYITYIYHLEGDDDKWIELAGNELSFPNLQAGKYTLEIKARNHNDNASLPLQLHILVQPYFWQTPWFYLLLVCIMAAAFYGLYRYRLRQIVALQRIRQQIAKDLHDDIGATISSIGILADIAGKENIERYKTTQYLQTISEESKHVANALSDIVWTINPRNDSVAITFSRLLRYATELMDAKNIVYEIDIPEEGMDKIELKMEVRQNLYLILKEVVNNLIKYAEANRVYIRVVVGQYLEVTIRDNGIGFDMDNVRLGNGILNMKKRASDIQGSISIVGKRGEGTTVTLRIPLRTNKI